VVGVHLVAALGVAHGPDWQGFALLWVGQKVAVTAVDEPPTVEFRHSMRRQSVPLTGALLVAAAMVAAFNLVSGRQWWHGLSMIPI
jgi:hypothetical protein